MQKNITEEPRLALALTIPMTSSLASSMNATGNWVALVGAAGASRRATRIAFATPSARTSIVSVADDNHELGRIVDFLEGSR